MKLDAQIGKALRESPEVKEAIKGTAAENSTRKLHDEQERREAAERERTQTEQEAEGFRLNVSQNPSANEPTRSTRRDKLVTGRSGGRPRNPAVEAVVEATGVSKSTATCRPAPSLTPRGDGVRRLGTAETCRLQPLPELPALGVLLHVHPLHHR